MGWSEDIDNIILAEKIISIAY